MQCLQLAYKNTKTVQQNTSFLDYKLRFRFIVTRFYFQYKMNLSPHRLHVKELNALGASGGSGSGSDEDTPRKSKKKSRSPLEKPFSSSEEERLVKSSDDDATENYGTFSDESITPKRKQRAKSSRLSKESVSPKKQPTEMEGSAVHGLDVFSNEEKASQLRKLTPPALVQTRKFPPDTGTAKSSDVSKDKPSTGAMPKKVGSSDKLTSKHKSSKTSSPRTESNPHKETEHKQKSVSPVKCDKNKISKLKSTYKSPRKAIQKCFSLLTSPTKKEQKDSSSLVSLAQKEQETMRPRTRSQTQKAKEDKALINKTKNEQETKLKKKVRERSASSSARQPDKMSLISSMDKSSESDSSPQGSPRKSRRRDPLVPGLFGKQLEDVCSIVSKPDSEPCVLMELDPSSDVDNSSTGDKLLLPLAQLSTEADKDSNDNAEEKSKSDPSDEE